MPASIEGLSDRGARRSPRPLATFGVTFGLLWGLSLAWVAATPIFASPDENAHAAKAIGQMSGQMFGETVDGIDFPVYALPEEYSYSPQIVCFAYAPTVDAACGVELGDEGTAWFASWVSTYNPVYYYLVGWPTVFVDGSAGIYAMRAISALLGSALLAGAVTAAFSARRARWMPLGTAFLASPMVLFLVASVNPQGLEIASGALLVVALLRLLENHVDESSTFLPRRTLWMLVTVSAIGLAIARGIGPLWVVAIVAGCLALSGWPASKALFTTRTSYGWISAIAAGGLFSLGWTAASGLLGSQAEVGDAPLVGHSPLEGFWVMLRDSYVWLESAAGVFGWLDTPLPGMVLVIYFGAVAVTLALAVSAPARRERWAVALAVLGAIILPAIVQAASVSRTGIIWQGRYSLVLYLVVLLIAAWALSRSAPDRDGLSARLSAIVTVLVTGYGVAAFALALHRYVVGADGTVGEMLLSPSWQPPLGWQTLVALFVVLSVTFGAVTIRSARRLAEPSKVPR